MNRKVSNVWDHYVKSNDKSSVTCNICAKTFNFFGNTSNLHDHFKRKHSESELTPSTSSSSTSNSNATLSASSEPEAKKPKTVQLKLTTKESLPASRVNKINRSLVKMIAVDYQPLSIVEDEGFKEFVHELEPLYNIPSRRKLTDKLMPEQYDFNMDKTKKALSTVPYVALTSDIWTANDNVAYLCVTSHFVQDNELKSRALKTVALEKAHTAENLAAVIKGICDEFSIFDKITIVATDNGANIKRAVALFNKPHLPCIAHTLNRSVDESIKSVDEITEILAKVRNIIGHFKRSNKSAEILRSVQKQMNLPQLSLIQDVVTRWNSEYLAIKRLIEIKIPLCAAIASITHAPQMLDASEWEILNDCVVILKPLYEITTELSGQKYPTLSMVVPLVRGLQVTLRTAAPNTDRGRQLLAKLSESIQRRIGSLETNKIVAKASICDPRFKKRGFGLNENANQAQRWFEEELTSVINRNEEEPEPETRTIINQSSSSEPEPSSQAPINSNRAQQENVTANANTSIWDHFDKSIVNTSLQTPMSKAIIMVKQYLELPLHPRTQNPIPQLHSMPESFKELKELQFKYLAMPATSVPSESLFSKAGYIKNERRNRLSPDNLNTMLFLNSVLK